MRFLLDQDVYSLTASFLRSLGHDVVTASEVGRSRSPDAELIELAAAQDRIFVTRDRDFGALVFLEHRRAGVLYLRAAPRELPALHDELRRALDEHPEADLRTAFVVVEPGRHRFRRVTA